MKHYEGKKIVYAFNGDFRERFAYVLATLENLRAAEELGCNVILIIQSHGVSKSIVKRAIGDAKGFYNVACSPKIVVVPKLYLAEGTLFPIIVSWLFRWYKADFLWTRKMFIGLRCMTKGIPTLLEEHAELTGFYKKELPRLIKDEKLIGIASISGTHKAHLESFGIPSEKIIVLHSGVNINDYAVTEWDNEGPVTYAGSFYKGRGLELIIEAARLLPQYQFRLIGGDISTILNKDEILPENIEVIGKQSKEPLKYLLQKASILLAPYSLSSQDSSGRNIASFQSPLKLMEYMAIGKPIITSKIGAIPEIVEDGLSGRLIESDSAEKIVEAIKNLKANPERCIKLSKGARERSVQFDWNVRVKHLLDFVDSRI